MCLIESGGRKTPHHRLIVSFSSDLDQVAKGALLADAGAACLDVILVRAPRLRLAHLLCSRIHETIEATTPMNKAQHSATPYQILFLHPGLEGKEMEEEKGERW